nr:transposase [Streptomyces griseorubiginosus]
MTQRSTGLDYYSAPATAAGYRQLLDWARQCGTVLRAGVECTGSYGAGLARYLAAQQVAVVEVNQPDGSTRRRCGKTDAVDAEAAARAALSGIARALPKSGGERVEALRMLRLAKNSAVKARTQALNQLKSVLVNAPSALREELEPLSRLLRRCAELADTREGNPAADTAVFTLRLLAQRVVQLRHEATELETRITRLYLERRTAEIKGKREVMRCLKRYAAREVYHLIRADMITRHQQSDASATLMTAA